jgi:hypothetical protein
MHNEINLALGDFSLTRSGIFYRLLIKLGLTESTTRGFAMRSIVISGATWLPLLILSALQGLALNDSIDLPFLKDYVSHVRFLLIIPMLVFAEGGVDNRLRMVTSQFFKAGILNADDLPHYQEIKNRVMRLTESVAADTVILVIVAANIFIRWWGRPVQINMWMFNQGNPGGSLSWAGDWFFFFSVPIFQFILLRWVWRWMIWVYYFFKISQMPLKLSPAHPDLAGGIGFLGMPPGPFMRINLALAVLFSALITQRIVLLHQRLPDYYIIIGGFAFFSILLNVLPLLPFLKPLAIQRRAGIYKYSTLIMEHHKEFEEKWFNENKTETILGAPDASSMIDLNSSFETILKMRIVPFNLKIMMSSIVISVLPLIPLFALEFNVIDILKHVMGLLL